MIIPKIFHFIWVGTKPILPCAHGFMAGWQAQHPDWQVKLWTDDNLPAMQNQHEYDAASILAEKADILRYELVFQFGGIYVDVDCECLRNLEPLIENLDGFLASEDDYRICNCVIGAVPQHPFFKQLLDNLPAAFARDPNDVVAATGPGFLTDTFHAWVGHKFKHPDCWEQPDLAPIRIFPPKIFYPVHYTKRIYGELADAYSNHLWAMSWR